MSEWRSFYEVIPYESKFVTRQYSCSTFLPSISDDPGAASVSSATLRTISIQTGSTRLSASDINDHKWLFSGPAWQLETTVSCAQNGKECVCFCTRVREGRKRTWAPGSPDTSRICRPRSHVGICCGRPRTGQDFPTVKEWIRVTAGVSLAETMRK